MTSTSKQRDNRRAAREAKLVELSTRLEQAVGELVTGEDWLRAMEFSARFRSRSFANTLLIFSQHAKAYEEGRVPTLAPSYVAGFRQWQQLGRFVVKGQAGYMIRCPVTARFTSYDPSDPNSWRRLRRGEDAGPGEHVRTGIIGVKPGYVWDVTQTDGKPIPASPQPLLLAGHAPPGLQDALVAQVQDRGFRILDAPDRDALGGANGVTDFANRTVTVRVDMPDAARVKTLAHELGHIALDHRTRSDQGLCRGIKEVEAESVAAMITAAYGMDSTDYTVPYVAEWSTDVADRDPVDVIRSTGELVRKTALTILDKLPEPPTGDGAPPVPVRHSTRAQERQVPVRQRPSSTTDLSLS
ncbi:MAG: ArdC-like ssDNA-binding domain-containing protein [bacterium]